MASPSDHDKRATKSASSPSHEAGASSLMGLFAPPPTSTASATASPGTTKPTTDDTVALPASPPKVVRDTSAGDANRGANPFADTRVTTSQVSSERTPLLASPTSLDAPAPPPVSATDVTPKLQKKTISLAVADNVLYNTTAPLHKSTHSNNNSVSSSSSLTDNVTQPFLRSIREVPVKLPPVNDDEIDDFLHHSDRQWWRSLLRLPGTLLRSSKDACHITLVEASKSTTWIGAVMFVLYHIVFCLTMGSTITRPYSAASGNNNSMLGLMTKMTAVGIIASAPVFWWSMGQEVPALYPTVDLFSAPFLANIAALVDQAICNDDTITSYEESDAVFLATFTALASVALFVCGLLLAAASVFKLANLGTFLPSAVLSGFFSAIGVLLWTLALKVDTQKTVADIFWGPDSSWETIKSALIHHTPSVVIALIMKWLGPMNPFYVAGLVAATIVMFYVIMMTCGYSMEQMVEWKWFWSKDDLIYASQGTGFGFTTWAPPVPFGWINSAMHGKIHWGAFRSGLGNTLALAFLYMIRCSLHAAALKKNVTQLRRKIKVPVIEEEELAEEGSGPQQSLRGDGISHRRKWSEIMEMDQIFVSTNSLIGGAGGTPAVDTNVMVTKIESPKPPRMSLKDLLWNYGLSQFLSSLVGTFGITPSIAATSTMYTVGAENVAPQVGSVLLLFVFYMTGFELVSYIPKPAFSSLLVLSFLDIMVTWLYESYFKTKEKAEWFVVPVIVILAFALDLLSAVFLGIAMSTFFFVAAFFRSGVVKFLAHGITIRSTIERPPNAAKWLDENGELIQILVLQNYLFFGNASSVLWYITTMFEEPDEGVDELLLPPCPKIVILDFSLVTGMDGSAVDVMSDILNMCSRYGCKVFFSGMSVSIRQTLALGGVKPENTRDRKARRLRFFMDLDSAIGKAEDYILMEYSSDEAYRAFESKTETGLVKALCAIDEQHDTSFADCLRGLEQFTELVIVEPGQILYEHHNVDRGLFFIEEGIMKIERLSDATLTRTWSSGKLGHVGQNMGSLNQLKARSSTIGRELAKIKARRSEPRTQSFRVARIGPGWVLGSIEALSGHASVGSNIAVTSCRLHHLSFKKLGEIEEEHALLVLNLYKLLSMLMAKRQEITISHLATLHSIMGSPAAKPVRRNDRSLGKSSLLGHSL